MVVTVQESSIDNNIYRDIAEGLNLHLFYTFLVLAVLDNFINKNIIVHTLYSLQIATVKWLLLHLQPLSYCDHYHHCGSHYQQVHIDSHST